MGDFPIAWEAKQALEKLDQLVTRLMLDAEDKCRKLYACHHKFSPDVESWVERCHAYYRQLIKLRWQMLELNTSKPWKTGINVGNLKRFARSCEIDSPMSLSLDQLMSKYIICRVRVTQRR